MCFVMSFQGADMVEFDVVLTKDHEPLVFHDYTVNLAYKKVRKTLSCVSKHFFEV